MNKILLLFIFCSTLFSCKKNTETEKFPKYDKNGKLIVYNVEEYSKLWFKNRKLKVTVIDTFCENQKKRAIKDIKNGKLIYFGFHHYEFSKMTKILKKYGIESKEHLGGCLRMGGFEPFCYQEEMNKEINRKYGENFIDSVFKIAQREFVLENPEVEYIEDGIDLREKYRLENKNGH